MIDALRTGSVTVAPRFNQLGIFILDGSGSMAEPAAGNITKAQAVNRAIRDVFTRFRKSRQRRNFSFAVVTFDHNAKLHTGVTPAEELADDGDYDPQANHGGATDIGAGLTEAKRVAEDFLRQAPAGVKSDVVLVLMSDGRDGDGGAGDPVTTQRVADEIKRDARFKIYTTYFPGLGSPDLQAEEHLKALSSDPVANYRTAHDAQTLRDFFLASTSSGLTL
jgi:Mg-chelatase subunit ChlD